MPVPFICPDARIDVTWGEARVLLLSPDRSSLSETVVSALASLSSRGLRIEQRPLSDVERSADTWNAPLDGSNSPDAVVVVLAAKSEASAGLVTRSTVSRFPGTPIILIPETADAANLLRLLMLGAADFVVPPLIHAELLSRLWRVIEQNRRKQTVEQRLKQAQGIRQLVGRNPRFLEQVDRIPLVAGCDASVLITGETGTGKELFARAIHYLSNRTGNPFVPVNCGAIPTDLVENELFGHERGAFTGAINSQPGLIKEAEGGTVFLDEIDSLPALAQVKLLRFVQEKEYRALGSARTRKADVRVLAATNSDLKRAVRDGRLRQDLFYRLNVIPLSLPPLRERTEDIPLLARHFLARSAAELDRPLQQFSAEAMEMLLLYRWPGNVRELQNVVERAVILSKGPVIEKRDIILTEASPPLRESLKEAKARMIAAFERRYIEGLLVAHQGNITRAAQAARKNRRAFFQLIRKHGIDVSSLKYPAL